ncbi:4-alpha-glucanotransferase [Candidatus Micrarchaeota archaeon]|nr:4-alpha-glucanotransferase [Candidatus Micrarchaeota archaeon]
MNHLALNTLARQYGIQTQYQDASGKKRRPPERTILALLNALGCPIHKKEEAASWLKKEQLLKWRRTLDPVIINWDKETLHVPIRIPESESKATYSYLLQLENGEIRRGVARMKNARTKQRWGPNGHAFLLKDIRIPTKLPWGYHQLHMRIKKKKASAYVITAPRKAAAPHQRKTWGVFLPLHAFHSVKNPYPAYTAWSAFVGWIKEMKGGVVATLPWLPLFLENEGDVSPYSPVSRLAWNELWIGSPKPDTRSSTANPSEHDFLNYAALWKKRKKALETEALAMKPGSGKNYTAFQRFQRNHPTVQAYALFRAQKMMKKRNQRKMSQVIKMFAYAQFAADQQIRMLSEKARCQGVQLYLDFPLGVHPQGFDVSAYPQSFVPEARVGAPPDPVFKRGQDWGFFPLHPRRLREQGYHYFHNCLSHHMTYADILRIDHIMGLHRLWMIPKDATSDEGAYVHYNAEEMYAVLCLESRRHHTTIVGENLGTVPPTVNKAMQRHGLLSMYVLQYELATEVRPPPVPHNTVASLNTHDMPLFSAFWSGKDISVMTKRRVWRPDDAKREKQFRNKTRTAFSRYLQRNGFLRTPSTDTTSVRNAAHAFLGKSKAALVVLNLEDVWNETRPQNVPSTNSRFNWRRKTKYTFDAFRKRVDVLEALEEMKETRK